MAGFSVCRRLGATAVVGLSVAACLKTLDESRIDEHLDASGAAGGTGGEAGTGGSGAGGNGGDSGSGSGGSGGQGGTGGVPDAGPTFTAYDPQAFPLPTDIQGSLVPPVLIAADDTYLFRVTKDALPSAIGATLVAVDIDAGTGVQLVPVDTPKAMIAPVDSTFVFVAAGLAGTSLGALWRIHKTDPVTPEQVQLPAGTSLETAVAIVEGSATAPNTAFVSAKASGPGSAVLLRFPFDSGGIAEVLLDSTKAESGGDLVEAADCVYFISESNLWSLPNAGKGRDPRNALVAPVNNAEGVTADATHFYYTLTSGEIWRRELSPPACDGSGAPEERIEDGFTGIGDIVTFDNKLVWRAGRYDKAGVGGVFMYEIGGTAITQIAPGDGNPDALAYNSALLFFTTNELPAMSRVRQMTRP